MGERESRVGVGVGVWVRERERMGEERGPRGGGSACSARFEAMKPSYTACSSCEQNSAPRWFSGALGVGAGSVDARQGYLAALDLHLSDAIDLNRE